MTPNINRSEVAFDNLLIAAEDSSKKIEDLINALEPEPARGRHYKGKIKTRQWWSREDERSRKRKRIANRSRSRNR